MNLGHERIIADRVTFQIEQPKDYKRIAIIKQLYCNILNS